ncbi:hypothetical protein BDR04DRAFT_1029142, partial [Suillus decipiens]
EEVELFTEEMRRVLAFLECQGNWWQERAVLHPLEKICIPSSCPLFCDTKVIPSSLELCSLAQSSRLGVRGSLY